MQSFRAEFALLDALIEHLQRSISSNSFVATSPTQTGLTPPPPRPFPRFTIYIQSVLSLAAIRLHSPFRESYAPSNTKCVTAAMHVARALRGMNFDTLQFVDPIVVSHSL